jgi:hypothetical protein
VSVTGEASVIEFQASFVTGLIVPPASNVPGLEPASE